MAVLYIVAGINHFCNTAGYLSIMPALIPYKTALVYISGCCEIVFGALLFNKRTRHIAAWLIIILLIAVYPANIQMCINYYRNNNPYFWLTVLRLPLQFLLIWWAYIYTKKRKLS
jgi:uncharacterized membrane protein